MVSMILRPYIHNPYGINDIKALYSQPICINDIMPNNHNRHGINDIRPYIHKPYGINDIKALYSQPIWYQ